MLPKKLLISIANVEGTEDGWSLVIWSYRFKTWALLTPPGTFHRCLIVLAHLDFQGIDKND